MRLVTGPSPSHLTAESWCSECYFDCRDQAALSKVDKAIRPAASSGERNRLGGHAPFLQSLESLERPLKQHLAIVYALHDWTGRTTGSRARGFRWCSALQDSTSPTEAWSSQVLRRAPSLLTPIFLSVRWPSGCSGAVLASGRRIATETLCL